MTIDRPRRPRTLRTGLFAATALAASLALTGCGSTGSSTADQSAAPGAEVAGTVTITDAQQRTVEVPTNPETVVVTDWNAIRTLSDLGIEVDAVPKAVGDLPEDLAAYAKATTVGTLFEPDYEAIAAMEPDLVIVGARSGTPEVVKEFEKFAPAVIDMSVRPKTPAEQFTATTERVVQLGSIFGKEKEATALMDEIAADLEKVKEAATASGKTAMFVQVSDGTVSAYGPGSRFGFVYDLFGYQPTAAPIDDKGSHGEEISQEFFVKYNPQVLIVLDRAKAIGQKEKPALDILNNGLVNTTDAAKADKIVDVDPFSWYIAGASPTSWKHVVADMQETL